MKTVDLKSFAILYCYFHHLVKKLLKIVLKSKNDMRTV